MPLNDSDVTGLSVDIHTPVRLACGDSGPPKQWVLLNKRADTAYCKYSSVAAGREGCVESAYRCRHR